MAAVEARGFLARLDRKRRQIQRRRPTLRPFHERHHGRVLQLDARAAQQSFGLRGRHREVRRPDLDEPSVGAQTAGWEWRLAAADDRDGAGVRQRCSSQLERVLERLRRQQFGVVEDDHDAGLGARARVLGDRRADASGHSLLIRPAAVARVHADERTRILLLPLGEQNRLSIPRRRDDQRQSGVASGDESLDEPRPVHAPVAELRSPDRKRAPVGGRTPARRLDAAPASDGCRGCRGRWRHALGRSLPGRSVGCKPARRRPWGCQHHRRSGRLSPVAAPGAPVVVG